MYDVHVIFDATRGNWRDSASCLGAMVWGWRAVACLVPKPISVEEGEKARRVLLEGGFNVRSVRKPLIRKLQQARPGELGEIAAALAAHGVSVLTQYSDHANHLILLTDNDKLAAEITRPWAVNA